MPQNSPDKNRGRAQALKEVPAGSTSHRYMNQYISRMKKKA